MSHLRDYSDAALAAIGLQRRTATDILLPAIGMFGVGILVGAGLGLLLAPKRGRELRGDIGRGFTHAVQGVGAKIRRRRGAGELDRESLVVHDDENPDDVISATR